MLTKRLWFSIMLLAVCATIYSAFLHGVLDEIITLVAYCGSTCRYPFPIGPPLQFYVAEEVADLIIDLSVLGMLIAVGLNVWEIAKMVFQK